MFFKDLLFESKLGGLFIYENRQQADVNKMEALILSYAQKQWSCAQLLVDNVDNFVEMRNYRLSYPQIIK